MMSLFCPECNEKIIGRADKKFCSDQCRTQYHNKISCHEIRKIRRINNVLRKNRKILSACLGESEYLRVSRERLLISGFDFEFHTQQLKLKKGKPWMIIYDYGCSEEGRDEILISRIEKIPELQDRKV